MKKKKLMLKHVVFIVLCMKVGLGVVGVWKLPVGVPTVCCTPTTCITGIKR